LIAFEHALHVTMYVFERYRTKLKQENSEKYPSLLRWWFIKTKCMYFIK